MRTAALYDIHGNLPALEAVLQQVKRLEVDQLVIGGDVVIGPMSSKCLDRLLDIQVPTHFIQGNCEVSLLKQMMNKPIGTLPESVIEDIQWTAQQHSSDHKKHIESWPKKLALKVEGLGNVLFCHATPRNEDEIFTRLTSTKKLLPIFENLDVDIVVCGHTHMQFDRRVGKTRILNAGSIGMPFGSTGAHWLLLGPNVEMQNTLYDQKLAAEHIQKTNYPHAKNFAEKNILSCPSEETMLEIYQKVELK